MELNQTIVSASLQETEKLAKSIITELNSYRIILLSGDLGSGKTALSKAIAKHLGILENITSPTYTYCNTYKINRAVVMANLNEAEPNPKVRQSGLNDNQLHTLSHFDLYRLPDRSENAHQTAAEIGLEQALENPNSLVIIEWPERLSISWGKHLMITCEKSDQNHIFRLSSAEQ